MCIHLTTIKSRLCSVNPFAKVWKWISLYSSAYILSMNNKNVGYLTIHWAIAVKIFVLFCWNCAAATAAAAWVSMGELREKNKMKRADSIFLFFKFLNKKRLCINLLRMINRYSLFLSLISQHASFIFHFWIRSQFSRFPIPVGFQYTIGKVEEYIFSIIFSISPDLYQWNGHCARYCTRHGYKNV